MPNKNDINQQDEFNRHIRDKLENFSIPVDPECWDTIEQRLKPRKRKTVLWVVASVAVAASLVLGILFIPIEKNDADYISQNQYETKPSANISDEVSIEPDRKVTANLPVNDNTHRITPTTARKARKTVPANIDKQVSEPQSGANTLPVDDTVDLVQKQEQESDKTSTPASDKHLARKTDNYNLNTQNNRGLAPELIYIDKADNNKWAFTAAISTNNSKSQGIDNNTLKSGTSDKPGEMLNPEYNSNFPNNTFDQGNIIIKDAQAYQKFDHSVPVSVKLAISKKFTDRLAVETGLTYTYLTSKIRQSGTSRREIKQELHYLGVPLNLIVNVWSSNRWDIYVSAGGMLEKGLHQKMKEEYYNSANKLNTNANVNRGIKGVQWSLNSSVGVSYNLFKDVGVFFEPQYSYYFENDQPASIRTDKKSSFGLSGGFRFEF